jgi:transposase-like protein
MISPPFCFILPQKGACHKEVKALKSTSWSPEWKAEAVKQKTLRGWNYSQLAKAAGLGVGQVQKYMTGKYHNDNPREPIERALGMR